MLVKIPSRIPIRMIMRRPFYYTFTLIVTLFSFVTFADDVSWKTSDYKSYFADLNGDNLPDLILQPKLANLEAKLYLGELIDNKPSITLANQQILPILIEGQSWLTSEASVVIADFTGDGKSDFWITFHQSETAALFASNGDGFNFSLPTMTYDDSILKWYKKDTEHEYVSGDFNGDGKADLLVLSPFKGKHYLYHTQANGEFSLIKKYKAKTKWGLKKAARVIIADYNNDGRDDVLAISKKKNKPNFIAYANEAGVLDKKGKKIKSKIKNKNWNSDDYSTILAASEDNSSLELIRLNNIGGGIDENGELVPAAIGGDFDDENEQCDQLFLSTTTKEEGLTCRPWAASSNTNNAGPLASLLSSTPELMLLLETPKKSVGIQTSDCNLYGGGGDLLSGTSVIAAIDCYGAEPPKTPTQYPGVVGGSYHPIGSTITVSLAPVSGAEYYEVYLSTSNSGYGNVGTTTSTRKNITIRSSYGYNYIKYKACRIFNGYAFCSGLSPWRRIRAYSVSGTPKNLTISPSSVYKNKPYMVSFTNPGGIVPGASLYLYKKRGSGTESLAKSFSFSYSTYTYVAPGESNADTYTYRAKACNPKNVGCGGSATRSITVINRAPTISGTPSSSVNENSAYSFTPIKSDPDGDSLTLSITGKPSWATFNASTGKLSGTPSYSNSGTYNNIKITVSDGSLSRQLSTFSITVNNVNRAPTISGTPANSVNENSAYSFTPTKNDPDGDSLTLSITGKPSWASFNTSTGRLSGTPNYSSSSTYKNIKITVSDGSLSRQLSIFSITVNNVNRAPTISGTPASSVNENSAYSFTPIKSDPDGDSLFLSITGKPSWATFNASTGKLSGTPSYSNAGTYNNIKIKVSDGSLSRQLSTFSITVNNVNRAPTISGTPANSVNENSTYSFTPTKNDPDGDSLTLSITGKPSWASFNASTGKLSGTPNYSNSGTYSNIKITVSDGSLSRQLSTFSIVVNNVNRAPTISGTPSSSVNENSTYSFTPTKSDPDGDSLTLSITGKPSWATFNASTGKLSGTPSYSNAGTYNNIKITVSDGSLSRQLSTFSITVNNVNRAPIITGQNPLSTSLESAISISVNDFTISDPDDTSWTLTVQDGANYTRSGNSITPASEFSGNLTVPVRVNDGDVDSTTFNATVAVAASSSNTPPVITDQNPLSTPFETAITISVDDFTIDDSDSTSWTLTVQNGTDYTRSNNSITPDVGFSGDLTVPVTVNDGSVDSAVFNAVVTVNSVVALDWLATGGSVIDTSLSTPTSSTSTFNGVTAGSGSVSGGGASYSVPIALPPGRAGMQPNVSLNYSSRSGVGIAGMGWSLSAGSAISRCGATEAQDGFTKGVSYAQSTDKLCLNGERLALLSGTYGANGAKYITEIDRFLIVEQLGGGTASNNSYFEVTLSSGTKQIFGKNSNSKVVADGAPALAPLSWLIERTQDVANVNHMSYNYTSYGVGEVLLTDITYTGSGNAEGNRKVVFIYENMIKADNTIEYRSSYIAGSKTRQSKRLNTITTYINNTTKVRDYTLEYADSAATKRSLLRSVEECGYIGGTLCRDSINFNWLDAKSTYKTELLAANDGTELAPSSAADLVPNIALVTARGDIDGNGSRDWANNFINAEGDNLGDNNFTYERCNYNRITNQRACIDVDFNLDGRTDSWQLSASGYMEIGYTTDNFTTDWSTAGVTNIDLSNNFSLVNIGDYNGDGWPDAVVYEAILTIEGSFYGKVFLYLHSQNLSNPYSIAKQEMARLSREQSVQYIGDLDGDGLPDIAISDLVMTNYDSRPTMTKALLTRIGSDNVLSFEEFGLGINTGINSYDNFSILIDVNGDGLSDWLGWINNQQNELHLRLNQGDGTFKAPQALGVYLPTRYVFLPDGLEGDVAIVPKFIDALKQMDVDGDGRTELIMPGNGVDDMLAEGCYTFNAYSGGAYSPITRCGSAIYDSYKISFNGLPVNASRPSKEDRNIYQYKALYFTENSDGSFSAELKGTELIAGANHAIVTDALGKGLSDLVFTYGCEDSSCSMNGASGVMAGKALNKTYFNRNYGATTDTVNPSKDDYQPTDMLISATNGATGMSSRWNYRPLSSGIPTNSSIDFYQADYTNVVDDEHFHFGSSMYVVSRFSQSNGIGSMNDSTYKYRGAMLNTQGRGFRGFRTIMETDVASSIRTTTDFLQKFPYSSLIERQQQFVGANTVAFSETLNDWVPNNNHNQAGSYNVFNRLSQSVACSLTTNGCGVSNATYLTKTDTAINQRDIDLYGNVSKSTTTITDDYGVYKTERGASFTPTPEWPHKITSRQVKSFAVTGNAANVSITSGTNASKTVTTNISQWNNTYRKPATVTTTGDKISTTTATTYTSDYGQVDVVSVSGLVNGAINTRETDIDYSSDGYFPNKVKKKASATVTHITSITTAPETGKPTSVTGVSGVNTTNQYDAFGRITQTSQTGMPAQTVRYYTPDGNKPNSNAKIMMVTRQAGTPEAAVYQDMLGRTLRSRTQGFAGANIYQDISYNNRGLKTSESNLHTGVAKYNTFNNYDALGRVGNKVSQQTNGTLTTTYTYNEGGDTSLRTEVKVIPATGTPITVYRTYNSLKQLVSSTDANNNSTYYAYDGRSNPIVIKDTNNNQITANYDALGRKLWVNDPNMGLTSFTYNAFGGLTSEKDANNKTTSYQVDLLGRVTSRTADSSTATFTWDTKKLGLLSQHSDKGITKEFNYDDASRVTDTTITVDGKPYTTTSTYDGNYGRVKSLTYPSGLTVGYQYSARGYLTKEYNAAGNNYPYRLINNQDALGNITDATLGDSAADINLTATFSNISGQMLTTTATGNYFNSSTTIHDLRYYKSGYDSYGNLTTASNGVAGLIADESFSYDGLHRLTNATVNAGGSSTTINYAYDDAGNITKKSDYSQNNNSAYQYTNGTNQISQITLKDNSVTTFGYDFKGNQTTRNGSTEVTYNTFNKPLIINKNSASFTFTYGADLARYKQVRTVNGQTITTHYIDKHYEVEMTGTGSNQNTKTKAYISDVAIVTDGNQSGDKTLRFTLRDRLGSATTFANHDGNATTYRHFDPFGKPRSGDWSLLSGLGLSPRLANNPLDTDMPTRKGFTDHEHLDEAELIHMNGRVYDYNVGRFMSVDPLIQSPANSQSLNPYSYIMNNPLSGTDPTGYASDAKEDVKIEDIAPVTGSRLGGKKTTKTTTSADGSRSKKVTTSNGAGQRTGFSTAVAKNDTTGGGNANAGGLAGRDKQTGGVISGGCRVNGCSPHRSKSSDKPLVGVGANPSIVADFTPIIGDAKSIIEAIVDPSLINISAAVLGIFPIVGDAASIALKGTKNIRNTTKQGKHLTLTNKQAKAQAEALGLRQVKSNIPKLIQKHTGKNPVYYDKSTKSYYSPDKAGHRANNAWKQFDRNGNRQTGIFDGEGNFNRVSN